jgi:hypothetical protein
MKLWAGSLLGVSLGLFLVILLFLIAGTPQPDIIRLYA